MEQILDLADAVDPAATRGSLSDRSNGDLEPRCPSGSDAAALSPTPNDWAHANSVTRGTERNYVMSFRHLSAVMSFSAETFALEWALSAELPALSTFSVVDDAGEFRSRLRASVTENFSSGSAAQS